MPVTYDQPGVDFDHQGVTYDGTVNTVNDGNSRPTVVGSQNSQPVVGSQNSQPAVSGNYSSRPENA